MEPQQSNPQQPVQTPPPASIPPIPHKRLTILIVVLLSLLLSAVGIFGYQMYKQKGQVAEVPPVEPTPTTVTDETTEWKTYTDQTQSYEFKYPSYLKLTTLEGNSGVRLSTHEPDTPIQNETVPYVILVQDEELVGNNNLTAWAKEKTIRPMPDGTTKSSISGSILPYTAVKDEAIDFDTFVENEFKNIYVKNKNNLVVMFSLNAGYDTGSSYKESSDAQEILDQILSTFRFVEENADACSLIPEVGNCRGRFPNFYFDKETGTCKESVWGGCGGVRPFETMEGCQAQCEQTT